jgi:hypothetical protein
MVTNRTQQPERCSIIKKKNNSKKNKIKLSAQIEPGEQESQKKDIINQTSL